MFAGLIDETVGMKRELFIPMHAGHSLATEEQVRGGSEIEGWLDCQIAVTRRIHDRFFTIDGRGVADPITGDDAVPVIFDPGTHKVKRHVTGMTKGATKKAASAASASIRAIERAIRIGELKKVVLRVVVDNPGINTGDLELLVSGNSREVRAAVAELRLAGEIVVRAVGKALLHWIAGEEPPL